MDFCLGVWIVWYKLFLLMGFKSDWLIFRCFINCLLGLWLLIMVNRVLGWICISFFVKLYLWKLGKVKFINIWLKIILLICDIVFLLVCVMMILWFWWIKNNCSSFVVFLLFFIIKILSVFWKGWVFLVVCLVIIVFEIEGFFVLIKKCFSMWVSVFCLMGLLIIFIKFFFRSEVFNFLWFVVVMVIMGIEYLCLCNVCKVLILFIMGIWMFINIKWKGLLFFCVCSMVFNVLILFLVYVMVVWYWLIKWLVSWCILWRLLIMSIFFVICNCNGLFFIWGVGFKFRLICFWWVMLLGLIVKEK